MQTWLGDPAACPHKEPLPYRTDLPSFWLQGIIKHLGKVLSRYPPPAPTEAAIRLVEAVGKLQNFVSAGWWPACWLGWRTGGCGCEQAEGHGMLNILYADTTHFGLARIACRPALPLSRRGLLSHMCRLCIPEKPSCPMPAGVPPQVHRGHCPTEQPRHLWQVCVGLDRLVLQPAVLALPPAGAGRCGPARLGGICLRRCGEATRG